MANGTGGANTYGGKDSWDDYDNSNTQTPKVPSPNMQTRSTRPGKQYYGKMIDSHNVLSDKRYNELRGERTTDMIVNKGGT